VASIVLIIGRDRVLTLPLTFLCTDGFEFFIVSAKQRRPLYHSWGVKRGGDDLNHRFFIKAAI
jgi:hypothetical protein